MFSSNGSIPDRNLSPGHVFSRITNNSPTAIHRALCSTTFNFDSIKEAKK
jgi:hypothetical protein